VKLVKPVMFLTLLVAAGFVLVLALEASAPQEPNILEVLQELNQPGGLYAGEFDILFAALAVADPVVTDTLTGNGQHTFFAPNRNAWSGLPQSLLPPGADDLPSSRSVTTEELTPEDLTQILLYHIINGKRSYQSLARAQQVRTVQGEFIYLVEGTLIDALGEPGNFVATDIEAGNGMIHIIDAVLLPYPP
jgi:transforming growth factor-beta-induced protein